MEGPSRHTILVAGEAVLPRLRAESLQQHIRTLVRPAERAGKASRWPE